MSDEVEIQDDPEVTSAKPLIVAIVIVLASAAGVWWLLTTGPQQEKVAKQVTVPAVEVQPLVASDQPVSIQASGNVEPAREVILSPEVEGRVVKVHPDLEPGAIVEEGDLLLAVDPAGYRIAVRRAEAALQSAQAELAIEKGQRRVAEREWELFATQQGGTPASSDLALREPQMKQVQARVAVAEAQLADARLALRRTSLTVPFDAFVSEESLEIGRRVSTGTPVATLIGVDEFWATVTMPVDAAERLSKLDQGAAVTVTLTTGLGEKVVRDGKFVRRLPGVEAEGRMARALVAIEDPLGRESGKPAISLGSYVQVEIDAGVLTDAYEVPREALRENGQVWVRDADGKLQFRDVLVLWRADDVVYVRGEFKPNEQLVTSYLANPLPGIDVRVREEK